MQTFRHGLKQGVSIGLGYLSVSFSFGIQAVQSGLTVWQAVLISLTNLTSAGQLAGLRLIALNAAYFELFLTEFVINIRYALMSLALSQKAHQSFRTPHRLAASAGVTDEIFAVSSIQPEQLKPVYMYGLMLMPYLGWALGTLLGAVAGTILPANLTHSLGIALYGMFIAIIVPPSRKSKGILAVVITAAVISTVLHYYVKAITAGFAMILASVAAAAIGAWLFPQPVKEEQEAET